MKRGFGGSAVVSNCYAAIVTLDLYDTGVGLLFEATITVPRSRFPLTLP